MNAGVLFSLSPFPLSYLQYFQDCVMFRPNVTPYPENAVGACVRTARKSRDLLRVRPLRAPAFSGWCVPQGDRYMPRLHGRFSRSARRQRRLRSIASGVDAPSKREYVAIRLGRNTSRRRLTRLRAVCRIPSFASRSVSCPSHLAPARYLSSYAVPLFSCALRARVSFTDKLPPVCRFNNFRSFPSGPVKSWNCLFSPNCRRY